MSENDIQQNTENAEQTEVVPSEPQQKPHKFPLAAKALIIEGTSGLAVLLVNGLSYIGTPAILFWLLSAFWVVAAPVIGIVLCVIALCLKPHTRLNTALSLTGLLLPVIVVVTVIILLSQRVFVIALM